MAYFLRLVHLIHSRKRLAKALMPTVVSYCASIFSFEFAFSVAFIFHLLPLFLLLAMQLTNGYAPHEDQKLNHKWT